MGNLDVIRMFLGAGLVVQGVILLLGAFSVAAWAIIINRFIYFRRAIRESTYFAEVFWDSRDLAVAYKEAKDLENCPMARIFRTGYIELNKLNKNGEEENDTEMPSSGMELTFGGRSAGIANIERALRRAINTEITRMSQWVPFLATTGNTTPFIGLFGTVWGIMNSFHAIGQKGSASLAEVAPGISEALVATAAGLAVAIPAVIFFNFFMQKIKIVDSELQSFANDFLNIIERDIMPGKGGK